MLTGERQRLPSWFKTTLPTGEKLVRYNQTTSSIRDNALHTVCEEAKCPNGKAPKDDGSKAEGSEVKVTIQKGNGGSKGCTPKDDLPEFQNLKMFLLFFEEIHR